MYFQELMLQAAIHINEEQIWGNMYEFCSTELESRLTQPPLTCRVRFNFDFFSKRLLIGAYSCDLNGFWGVHLVMPQDEDLEDDKSVYGVGLHGSSFLGGECNRICSAQILT
ncbi:S2-RNase [Pyrus ussuriensis x Pyrus communis]|uniref:S2-RNase n=1 Tax=Pyrus ussuriensis x Pyrus communis TaxID=2448454 RepID=A0A5N5I7N7_9ROSA|nr:S2-RNase [Pyrus ussuriensis x Pyrus communis]